MRIRCASRQDGERYANTGNKAFLSIASTKKRLRMRVGVLFFAPILIGARVRPQLHTFEEYGKMAKKGGAPTKSEVLTQISKDTGLSRKQVGGVFDSLSTVIKKSLRGGGLFTVPGLMKLKVVKKPATKAREGVNPFTGEKMTFKAKPASKKVRILPLKNLKAMVNS
jgi:DNA-binding protein HU-beta